MPYYVYAIHTDETSNRLYGTFDDYKEAAAMEADMRRGNVASDNYFVTMFFAQDEKEAQAIADAKRSHPKS